MTARTASQWNRKVRDIKNPSYFLILLPRRFPPVRFLSDLAIAFATEMVLSAATILAKLLALMEPAAAPVETNTTELSSDNKIAAVPLSTLFDRRAFLLACPVL